MSADAVVIKEFLVALGFQLDEKGLAKFGDTVAKATKVVTEFAAGVEAAAVGVVAAVAKMADGMEQLYFASERTQAAVENIQGLALAAAQLGSSAGGARGSLEGLASFLRNNPQGDAFLAGLGVTAHDSAEQIVQLSTALRGMPFYQANTYAGLLGIDEKTLIAMRSGEFDRYLEEHRARVRAAGVDEQKAAEDSHAFMVQLRNLGDTFQVLADKVTENLVKRAGGDIARFQQWVQAHFEQITNVITALARAVLNAADVVTQLVTAIASAVTEIIDIFTGLDQHTKGLIEAFAAVGAAWLVLNTAFATSPLGIILEIGAAILLLWDDYQTWKKGGQSLIDWGKWEPSILKAKEFLIWMGEKLNDLAERVGGWQVVLEGFAVFVAGTWAVRIVAALVQVGQGFIGLGRVVGISIGGAAGKLGGLMQALGLAGAELAALDVANYLAGDQPLIEADRDQHPTSFGRWIYDNNPAARWIDRQLYGSHGDMPSNLRRDTREQQAIAAESFAFWKAKGATDAGAASMVAAERRESRFDPTARGDKDASGNYTAGGSFQWHRDRRDAILKATGIDVWTSDHAHQLEGAYEEMRQHLDAGAGRAFQTVLQAANTTLGAGGEVNDFERPAERELNAANDASYAEQYLRLHQFATGPLFQGARSPPDRPDPDREAPAPVTVTSTTTVNVQGSSDPQATAAEVARAQDGVHQRLARHLQPAAS